MRKIIIVGLIIFGAILIINKQEKSDEEIRIRILANSNELNDQLDKIIVKEEVIKILENQNESKVKLNQKTVIEFSTKLKENLDSSLASKIKVEYKKTNFPAKSKNGKILKAGKYQTLLITIEEGKGKNWWSVLYPEFFEVEYDDNNEIEYKLYLKEYFKSKWKICENAYNRLHKKQNNSIISITEN